MYTTRYLGSEKYGILSFAIAFASITLFMADIGIASVIIRDVARDKTRTQKYLVNSLFLKIILAAVTLVSTAAIGSALNYPSSTMQIVLVISMSLIIVSFSGIISSILQAYEVMEYLSLGSIIYNSTMLILALLAIHSGIDVYGFSYVYLISSIIFLVYYAVVALRKIPLPKWDIDFALWKYIVKEAIPFGLSLVFVRVYYYIDTVMISLMILNPNEAMGWYNAAYRMVLVLAFIPVTFLGSIYPIMSNFYVTSDKYLGFIFERSFKYLMIIAIPIGVGTTLLGNQLILLIYGSDFVPSTIALQILIWSEVLIFLNAVFGNLFNSINRQGIVAKQTILATALNIILNLVLIPEYSYVGASAATVATQAFAFCFLMYFASQEGYSFPRVMILHLSKVLFACFVMALFIELLSGIPLLLLILIAAIVYLIIIVLTGVTDKIDIQMARQLINGVKAHGSRNET
jgi:O-antigen/teichoic acid export membrane protein